MEDEDVQVPEHRRGRINEWTLFLNKDGEKVYNKYCAQCVHSCKQSFRVEIEYCKKYEKAKPPDEEQN